MNQPFAKEAEYKEKSARLKEVDILLNMKERDNQILDEEPDESNKNNESAEKVRGQKEHEGER